MKHTIPLSLLAAVLVLAGFGCGSRTTQYGDTSVTEERDGTITVTNKEGGGTYQFTTNRLVEGFPENVPLYPDAAIQTSQVYTGGAALGLLTQDAPGAVRAWYAAEMVKQGWTETSRLDSGEGLLTYWQNSSGHNGLLTIVTTEKGTEISFLQSDPVPAP